MSVCCLFGQQRRTASAPVSRPPRAARPPSLHCVGWCGPCDVSRAWVIIRLCQAHTSMWLRPPASHLHCVCPSVRLSDFSGTHARRRPSRFVSDPARVASHPDDLISISTTHIFYLLVFCTYVVITIVLRETARARH